MGIPRQYPQLLPMQAYRSHTLPGSVCCTVKHPGARAKAIHPPLNPLWPVSCTVKHTAAHAWNASRHGPPCLNPSPGLGSNAIYPRLASQAPHATHKSHATHASHIGNYIHNVAKFFSGLVIAWINCWQIELITLTTGPFTVAARSFAEQVGSVGLAVTEEQKIRLSIARVVLLNLYILLLDEVTGGLDFEAERTPIRNYKENATFQFEKDSSESKLQRRTFIS
ncbi:hypothetical protein Fmac_008059 [Flemingia macrophylla]|uniref:Uncharacterized protein n=1 Tax=Flemingia macrophylla TaxID=520843 RepID=A0ABD1MWE9_9FABA